MFEDLTYMISNTVGFDGGCESVRYFAFGLGCEWIPILLDGEYMSKDDKAFDVLSKML